MTKYLIIAILAFIIGLGIWFWNLSGPQKLNVADKAWLGESQSVYTDKGIKFGDAERQKLDIFWPTEKSNTPNPVVIFYHGGSWYHGEREGYAFLGRAMASRGYVTVIADYRKHPDVIFPAFVEDAANAYVWTEKNITRYNGDPKNIFVMGHSAGAHLAMMITLDPQWLNSIGSDPTNIKGIVGLAGPYDFLPFDGEAAKAALGQWPKPEETQPITYARGDAAPMLLLTGSDDTTVNPRNGRALKSAITDVNGEAETIEYSNMDHYGIIMAFARPFRNYGSALKDTVEFIEKHSQVPQ